MAASGLSCRKPMVGTLKSGCGFGYEFAKDGCNGTRVKLEASKPT